MAIPSGKVLVAECPECETRIRFPKAPQIGAILTCQECDETLQVVSLSPLELDWAYDDNEFEEWEEEEWDDDSEDDYDDDDYDDDADD